MEILINNFKHRVGAGGWIGELRLKYYTTKVCLLGQRENSTRLLRPKLLYESQYLAFRRDNDRKMEVLRFVCKWTHIKGYDLN